MHKKSQMVIFVIFGLIVLGLFTFIFILNRSVANTTFLSQTEKFTLTSSKIDFRVQQCIEKSLNDGIILLGSQGGYILPGQPGAVLPFDLKFIETSAANITYRIEKRQGIDIPAYPCRSNQAPPRYCNFANLPSFPNLDTFFYGRIKPLTIADTPYSVQSMLNSFLRNQTLDCLTSNNLAFSFGEFSSSIKITDEGVTATVDVPINAFNDNSGESVERINYNSFKEVRLKKINDAVDQILELDNSRLNFKIKEDSILGYFDNKLLKIKDLEVEILHNIKDNDDVIKVTDYGSNLAGKPFIFSFARKNRPPVLDLISDKKSNDYEFILLPGDELSIVPIATDPDEDNLIYDYIGWKSDELKNSINFKSGPCEGRCANIIVQESDIGVHSITVKAFDGELEDYQLLRVRVVDKLTAIATPVNQFGSLQPSREDPYFLDATKSILPDSNQLYLYVWSIISPSRKVTDILAYNGLGTPRFPCLSIPSKFECQKTKGLNINNIQTFEELGPHNLTLSVTFNDDNKPRTSTDQKEIQVTECIPHRSDFSAYPFHAAIDKLPDLIPANELDLFRANHTCCNDDGTIATGKKCYEIVITKCRDNLGSGAIDDLIKVIPLKEISGKVPELVEVTDINKLQPDQFFLCSANSGQNCEVTFTQYCGNRGNACSGRIDYRLTKNTIDNSC